MDVLWHGVPRLDTPDKIWLLPAPVAKWVGAGALSGPILSQLLVLTGGRTPEGVWSEPIVWVVWLLATLVGCIGAFYHPGGLNIGQWTAVFVEWILVPRRATWTG